MKFDFTNFPWSRTIAIVTFGLMAGHILGQRMHPKEFVGPPRPVTTTVQRVSLVDIGNPSVTFADGRVFTGRAAIKPWLEYLARPTEYRTSDDAVIYFPSVTKKFVLSGDTSPVDVAVVGKKFKVLIKDPKTTRCMEKR